ncbi:hypothetical protein Tco_0786504 [Tanacetum coccineum]
MNLLKEDVGNVPVWFKFHSVPMRSFSKDGFNVIATKIGTPWMLYSYTSDMCMQSWGRSSYVRTMIELQANADLKDTIMVAMLKLTGEGFYMCTIHVKYVKYEWKPPSTSTTLIDERIDKIERQITYGKLTLVDDEGKPLSKVVSMINVDSDSEVEDVVDDHAVFMASIGLKRSANSGYGTNSLLEQWRITKRDDYYPYDNDLSESHDMSENLQAVCDELDITVRGRKEK